MTEVVQFTTTVSDRDLALTIAQSVVEEGLAACAQVQGPITSIYRWEGSVEQSTEWYCHCKTTKPLIERLRTRVLQLHPYDLPEMIVTPIVAGHDPYLAWVCEQTRGDSTSP